MIIRILFADVNVLTLSSFCFSVINDAVSLYKSRINITQWHLQYISWDEDKSRETIVNRTPFWENIFEDITELLWKDTFQPSAYSLSEIIYDLVVDNSYRKKILLRTLAHLISISSSLPSCSSKLQFCSSRLPGCSSRLPGCSSRLPGCSSKLPGCNCRLPGCSSRWPGCSSRLPGCSSRSPVWGSRLPGCSCRLPGCSSRLPGCAVVAGCQVAGCYWAKYMAKTCTVYTVY